MKTISAICFLLAVLSTISAHFMFGRWPFIIASALSVFGAIFAFMAWRNKRADVSTIILLLLNFGFACGYAGFYIYLAYFLFR